MNWFIMLTVVLLVYKYISKLRAYAFFVFSKTWVMSQYTWLSYKSQGNIRVSITRKVKII